MGMKKQENYQPKEAAKIYHENGPKVDNRDQKWTVGARPAPFFSENTKKQPFVPAFDN